MISDTELQRKFRLAHLGRGPNGQKPIKINHNLNTQNQGKIDREGMRKYS